MTDIYTDNGYTDRAEYLDSLAEEYGMDINVVLNLAEILGPTSTQHKHPITKERPHDYQARTHPPRHDRLFRVAR